MKFSGHHHKVKTETKFEYDAIVRCITDEKTSLMFDVNCK